MIKLSLGDKKRQISVFPLRYEGDKCGEMFHGEGVAYFQGGHVYKVSCGRKFMGFLFNLNLDVNLIEMY